MPGYNEHKLVSCAMDGTLRVHDLCVSSTTGIAASSALLHKAQHSRIKNLDVCPAEPHMVWHSGVCSVHSLLFAAWFRG